MKKVLRLLKNIWFFNFLRRIYNASRYFNYKYWQILKWGFTSREDTNFTYNLKPGNIGYLAHTISVVTGTKYSKVMEYIRELETDDSLKLNINEAISRSPFKKFTDRQVHFGRRMGWYAFARILKPKIIVETGVDKGLGSVMLCTALLKNAAEGNPGRYYGTDINPDAGFLLTDKYKEYGEILYGDSIESLNRFTEKIDLFINDSDHSSDYEYREYRAIEKLLTDKTFILGDNSHDSDKLAVFSYETGRNFLFFREEPLHHWYPGAGIGISYKKGRN